MVSLVESVRVSVPQVDIDRSGFDPSQLQLVNGDRYFPQILGQFGKETLYLKSRMGFVKLALKNGVPLVPAYVFGANDLFYTSTFLQSFRVALTRRFRWVGQRPQPWHTRVSRTPTRHAYQRTDVATDFRLVMRVCLSAAEPTPP